MESTALGAAAEVKGGGGGEGFAAGVGFGLEGVAAAVALLVTSSTLSCLRIQS